MRIAMIVLTLMVFSSSAFAECVTNAEFPNIRSPVLIASGVFDFGAVPTAWYGAKDKLAHHEYRIFEKSGHFPHMEEQRSFDETLIEWLKRN